MSSCNCHRVDRNCEKCRAGVGWRPEGLDVRSHCAINMRCMKLGIQATLKCPDCEQIQEASFDAMLEALKKTPEAGTLMPDLSFNGDSGRKYRVVFIPDDSQEVRP